MPESIFIKSFLTGDSVYKIADLSSVKDFKEKKEKDDHADAHPV